jgi:hypothetical protein
MNTVTAPVATRRRSIRARLALSALIDWARSFTMAKASRRTVAVVLAIGKKVL